MFTSSPEETAKKILWSGVIEPKNVLSKLNSEDYNNILNFVATVIEEAIYTSKKANQIQIYKLLSQIKEYLNKREISDLGLRPSDSFVKSQLVLAMAHGVTLTLCHDDFITLADKVINELFHTNMIM